MELLKETIMGILTDYVIVTLRIKDYKTIPSKYQVKIIFNYYFTPFK